MNEQRLLVWIRNRSSFRFSVVFMLHQRVLTVLRLLLLLLCRVMQLSKNITFSFFQFHFHVLRVFAYFVFIKIFFSSILSFKRNILSFYLFMDRSLFIRLRLFRYNFSAIPFSDCPLVVWLWIDWCNAHTQKKSKLKKKYYGWKGNGCMLTSRKCTKIITASRVDRLIISMLIGTTSNCANTKCTVERWINKQHCIDILMNRLRWYFLMRFDCVNANDK